MHTTSSSGSTSGVAQGGTPTSGGGPTAKQLKWTLLGAGVDVGRATAERDLLALAQSRGIDLAQAHMKKNHLGEEKSPYLLQHRHNPVNWFPYGEAAFQMAKKEDKPILISIGYATCHWCHVMERESFEDNDVADLLNSFYVAIKVDREEHPDVDTIYMTAAQSMGVSGGWPLNVFVTPDLKPFFAGTYFPKRNFMSLLVRLAQAWRNDRSQLISISEQLHSHLEGGTENIFGKGSLDVSEKLLAILYEHCVESFDSTYGGFGSAPKFPPSGQLRTLMRIHRRTQDVFALQMVQDTLDGMARGGMYDHLGGGFARYSTDEKWLIPHFEKMLYDNALLAQTYTEAYQITKNENYACVAREILDYVLNTLENKEQGGYYSAEDADSEGIEGQFYVWKKSEIEALLTPEEAQKFCQVYGVTSRGNFEHSKNNLNLLSQRELDWSVKRDPLIASASRKLFDAREKRPHPLKDDKQLTCWNGLMIKAMAMAGFVLAEDKYLASAGRAAMFIKEHLYDPNDRTLLRRYRDGEAKYQGTLDDYAYLIDGLLLLYQSSFDARWLTWAMELQATQDRLFADPKGGYFYTPSDLKISLIVRSKEFMDGACPSGNSIAAHNLLVLESLTYDESYGRRARQIFKSMGSIVSKAPQAFCHLLFAIDYLTDANQQLALIYPAGKMSDIVPFIDVVRRHYLPNLALAVSTPRAASGTSDQSTSTSSATETTAELGILVDKPLVADKATAYLCQGRACEAPTNDPAKLEDKLLAAVKPFKI